MFILHSSAPSVVRTGLQMELDAGEAGSYPGSGQTWSDLSSNSFDFQLGSGSGADANDPTYAAGPPAYFSTDGADYFLLDTAHSGEWIRTVGQSGTAFTVEIWFYPTANTADQMLFSTANTTADQGFCVQLSNPSGIGQIRFSASNGSFLNTPDIADSSDTINLNAWNCIQIAGTADGTAGQIWRLNDAAQTSWSMDSGWTTGDSTETPYLLVRPNALDQNCAANTRIAIMRGYNRALSVSELRQNWLSTKNRFGL